MNFPSSHRLSSEDNVNDKIWKHLHSMDLDSLSTLDGTRFSIDLIRQEVNSGCSPCPDILTADFGKKTSVMFVSTVYGLIYNYLQVRYNRKTESWPSFTEKFYNSIIQGDIGIYPRLGNIYRHVSNRLGYDPEFCFTELVKTVLVDLEGNVSGLDMPGFIHYFMSHEADFLSGRLTQIDSRCFIFTFSEIATFFTITTLAGVDSPIGVWELPNCFEVLFSSEKEKSNIQFVSRQKRTGNIEVKLNMEGSTFSKSIAFRTIFKVTNKDIYIIPLPHPSGANNKYWSSEIVRKQMEILIDKLV
ncbi:MAG: hypothetical protein ACYCV0_17870 [Desulfitobacteriaceae bacterium]